MLEADEFSSDADDHRPHLSIKSTYGNDIHRHRRPYATWHDFDRSTLDCDASKAVHARTILSVKSLAVPPVRLRLTPEKHWAAELDSCPRSTRRVMIAFVTPLRGRVVIENSADRTGSIWHPDQAQDRSATRSLTADRHGDRCSDALVAD